MTEKIEREITLQEAMILQRAENIRAMKFALYLSVAHSALIGLAHMNIWRTLQNKGSISISEMAAAQYL